MMQSSGTNTSLPWIGPFWNGMLSGKCRRPIVTPGCRAGISAQVMPRSALLAKQLLRIEHAERQADHRRDRRQRDVALGEIEPESDDLAPLPDAAADDAGVGNRGCVRAGARPGERETGHFLAARQARQVVVLLLLGAVVIEQFRRAQRVGHGDVEDAGRAAARDLGEHAGVRIGGELQSAVLLRDDHREEAARLEVIPDLGRQVAAPMRDVQVIEHAAQRSQGPSRKACSSAVRAGAFAGSSLRQSGPPVNSSPSHQTVPASSASRSVADIDGSSSDRSCRNGRVISAMRSGRTFSSPRARPRESTARSSNRSRRRWRAKKPATKRRARGRRRQTHPPVGEAPPAPPAAKRTSRQPRAAAAWAKCPCGATIGRAAPVRSDL